MALTDLISVPKGINNGIRPLSNRVMLSEFGAPRAVPTKEDAPITNPTLKADIITESVGPFRVTGHRLAVASLREVLAAVKEEKPEVYASLSNAGMKVCRLVRGSKSAWSNHSWGFAIDFYINGKLDPRGDNKVYRALAEMAPIFNRFGWFWGAGFGTEDAMHFEVGLDLLMKMLGKRGLAAKDDVLELGDRGPDVVALQKALVATGAKGLGTDGIFGEGTYAAVRAFQASRKLKVDGVVGSGTREALGLAA